MSDVPPHLEALENHLNALAANSESMFLSELDGYVAGLLTCPELIPPSEWLSAVFGEGDEDEGAVFDSDEQARTVVGLIMRHYNAVADDLAAGPGTYQPIIDVDARSEEVMWEFWVAGFERAMALRPSAWEPVFEAGDDDDAALSLAMMLALHAIGEGDSDLKPEAIEELTLIAPDLIPGMVETLYDWRRTHASGRAAGPARAVKVGRNEPCPCGSGKKFKKCCGAAG